MAAEADSLPPIVRLAQAITESSTYEEFLLKARADEDASKSLDYMASHSDPKITPAELFYTMKEYQARDFEFR